MLFRKLYSQTVDNRTCPFSRFIYSLYRSLFNVKFTINLFNTTISKQSVPNWTSNQLDQQAITISLLYSERHVMHVSFTCFFKPKLCPPVHIPNIMSILEFSTVKNKIANVYKVKTSLLLVDVSSWLQMVAMDIHWYYRWTWCLTWCTLHRFDSLCQPVHCYTVKTNLLE